jgi:hypothetical protein
MGKSLQRTATAAGTVLIIIGLGGLFNGMYRMMRVPQKPKSVARRERREAMRKALAEAANDPAFMEEMERESKAWDVAAGDGLTEG